MLPKWQIKITKWQYFNYWHKDCSNRFMNVKIIKDLLNKI